MIKEALFNVDYFIAEKCIDNLVNVVFKEDFICVFETKFGLFYKIASLNDIKNLN